MLDIKLIRQNPEKVKEGLKKKGVSPEIVDQILELDKKRREHIKETENLKTEQNKIGKKNIEEARKIKAKIAGIAPSLDKIKQEFNDLVLQIPNLPLDDVPVGKNEKDNIVIKEAGERPKFTFKPKSYLEIAEKLDLIDIKRAAKISGTRFGFLKKEAVLLEFALIDLAFDNLTREGFVPIVPPVMLKPEMAQGMGYLEQTDEEEAYFLPKDKLYLIGTSEQSIGSMHADEILQEKELPKRYVAFSTCFRREAGSYGKDTKGIFRVHQFDKIEMFSFCHPEKSRKEHEFLLSLEEKLMDCLKIPYRVLKMCSGELGVPAAAKYDIEAWIPSENRYRETHSTSNCTNFQARRLNIRYRDSKRKQLEFIHTLNGTAFALPRTLIAIIENYQQKDGNIKIPKALQKYFKFNKVGR
ncbi:MAG: serine--tRNA ligase [Candidatus Nealsonbacteria bacterium RBG_13_36_15]|uniref:Serine--tRNA ligase n=1 Tax=Candidatus Nealsonbacteria bacterium RBG_13_36_15 TaxID=1801660 RepID=A0A1G2DY77_9BACT|nr:MAG: serine--tRNA ligase [Candidatus Nealsonbacteria bacterium RBG_13_36_15]